LPSPFGPENIQIIATQIVLVTTSPFKDGWSFPNGRNPLSSRTNYAYVLFVVVVIVFSVVFVSGLWEVRPPQR
jgi:hypothetical protein